MRLTCGLEPVLDEAQVVIMGLRLRARQLELQGNVGETLPQRGGLVAAHPQTDVVNVFVIPRFDIGRSNGALANTAEAVEGNGSQSWFVSGRSWSQQDPIEFFEDVGSAEEADVRVAGSIKQRLTPAASGL
jgi:hypothetical protein